MQHLHEKDGFSETPTRWAHGAAADAIRRYSPGELVQEVQRILAQRDTRNGVWVFGYGSLMWNPDMRLQEKSKGRIKGYHRRLCVQSTVYRGTAQTPGVVLGLDQGGRCEGVVFHIASENLQTELLQLWEREMFADTYIPTWVKVQCEQGENYEALAFVVNRLHEQYLVCEELEQLARYVHLARGQRGRCRDYVLNTITSLHRMQMRDPVLERILMLADDLSAKNLETAPKS